ncbi:hypothetical protein [Pseudomonas cerasi]
MSAVGYQRLTTQIFREGDPDIMPIRYSAYAAR